jgi:hypothetical protein
MAETVSPELRPILKRAELGHRLIWTVVTTGILSFVAIIYLAEVNSKGHSNWIPPLLWLSSVAFAVASVLVPKVLLSDRRVRAMLRRDVDLTELATHPKGGLNETLLEQLQALAPGDVKVCAAIRWGSPPFLIRTLLHLGIVMPGFGIASIAKDSSHILPFAAVALLFQGSVFPRFQSLVRRVYDLSEETTD